MQRNNIGGFERIQLSIAPRWKNRVLAPTSWKFHFPNKNFHNQILFAILEQYDWPNFTVAPIRQYRPSHPTLDLKYRIIANSPLKKLSASPGMCRLAATDQPKHNSEGQTGEPTRLPTRPTPYLVAKLGHPNMKLLTFAVLTISLSWQSRAVIPQ